MKIKWDLIFFFENWIFPYLEQKPSNVSTNDAKYETEAPCCRPPFVVRFPNSTVLIDTNDEETGRDNEQNGGQGVVNFIKFLKMLVIHHSKKGENCEDDGNDRANDDTPPEGFLLRDVGRIMIRSQNYGDNPENNWKDFDLSDPFGKQFSIKSSHCCV